MPTCPLANTNVNTFKIHLISGVTGTVQYSLQFTERGYTTKLAPACMANIPITCICSMCPCNQKGKPETWDIVSFLWLEMLQFRVTIFRKGSPGFTKSIWSDTTHHP